MKEDLKIAQEEAYTLYARWLREATAYGYGHSSTKFLEIAKDNAYIRLRKIEQSSKGYDT